VIAAKHVAAPELPAAPAGDLVGPVGSRGGMGSAGGRATSPAPSFSLEHREQALSNSAARSRKAAPKMRQEQLPLAIVSRGRFDKSEPTVHKGEDLDIPTFVRRGVAMN